MVIILIPRVNVQHVQVSINLNLVTNCALCVSATTCSQCSPGYYINSGSCTPCSTSNCALCPGNSCSTCTTGFYPSQASSPVSCYTCPSNCLRCASPGGTC